MKRETKRQRSGAERRGGRERVRQRKQEINEVAERERQRVLPASELSLYSRPPL